MLDRAPHSPSFFILKFINRFRNDTKQQLLSLFYTHKYHCKILIPHNFPHLCTKIYPISIERLLELLCKRYLAATKAILWLNRSNINHCIVWKRYYFCLNLLLSVDCFRIHTKIYGLSKSIAKAIPPLYITT